MPQPMTPAPDAGQGLRKAGGFAREIARLMASAISPQPNTLGAMGIAGIRSMLPGGGSYEQERERYTDAAAPSDSVLDTVPALPGEDLEASLRRRFSDSPAHQRALMEGGSMAAPLAVHASPVKWSGQPTRAKVGTGEGGAAYGEGLYASVPQNAIGLDRRYRQKPTSTAGYQDLIAPDRQLQYDGVPVVDDWSTPQGIAQGYLHEAMAGTGGSPTQAIEAALRRMRGTIDDAGIVGDKARAALGKDAISFVEGLDPSRLTFEPYTPGSFHVWDVPDRLMDYDAPLSQQPDGIRGALENTYMGTPEARAVDGQKQRDLLRGMPQDELRAAGIQGHTYAGEAGSARTSGIEGDVPNFVIYDDAAVKPLGTFGSADEFLASDLYKQLKARIDAEDALRKAGKATPEAYAQIRAMFGGEGTGPVTHQTGHRPSGADNGAPLSDLTGDGRIYPDDVYGADGRRIYGTNQPGEDAVFALAKRLRGKPDAEITVYRAVPTNVKSNDILPGDWVALTKDYAALHGDGPLKGDYRIVTKKVRAGDIFTSGDSIHEWGYSPGGK